MVDLNGAEFELSTPSLEFYFFLIRTKIEVEKNALCVVCNVFLQVKE